MASESIGPVASRPRQRWWIRASCVCVLWAAVGTVLWLAWPVQPRLTLGNAMDYEIIGITPDSQSLVALTMRAVKESENRKGITYKEAASGPLQIWDLRSGRQHHVCVPDQVCSGQIVDVHHTPRMREPENRIIPQPQTLFCGPWIILRNGVLFSDWEELAFNYQTEEFRVINQRVRPSAAGAELSSGGRWCHDRQGPSLSILEMATHREKVLDVQRRMTAECFSLDERYFACSIKGNDPGPESGIAPGVTQVWNLETGKLAWSSPDRELDALAFSNDGRLLAGFQQHNSGDLQIVVFDAASGTVVHDWESEGFAINGGDRLAFVQDDTQLVRFTRFRYSDGIMRIQVHGVWDIATQEVSRKVQDFTQLRSMEYEFPTNCEPIVANGQLPAPCLGFNSLGLCDIASDRVLFPLSQGITLILATRDGRTVVFDRTDASRLRTFLNNRGIVIPSFLQRLIPRESKSWQVVDVESGQLLGSMPSQDRLCWLSPDEKTLITMSSKLATGPSPKIQVWDFPPRRPIAGPFSWSLVVPGVVMLVVGCRQLIRRSHSRGSAPRVP